MVSERRDHSAIKRRKSQWNVSHRGLRQLRLLLVFCLSTIACRPHVAAQEGTQQEAKRRKVQIRKKLTWDTGTDSSTDERGEARKLASFHIEVPTDDEKEQSTATNILDALTMNLKRSEAELIEIEEDLYYLDELEEEVDLETTVFQGSAYPQEIGTAGNSSNVTTDVSKRTDFLNETGYPSAQPTEEPTFTPTESLQPSDMPSDFPSLWPTVSAVPSSLPSRSPSTVPSMSIQPSDMPSRVPSSEPSVSMEPSSTPSQEPSLEPTLSMAPSWSPSISTEPTVSMQPSDAPSDVPSDVPSSSPTTVDATFREDGGSLITVIQETPSVSPTKDPTVNPTVSLEPSFQPSLSLAPSEAPTISSRPSWSMSPSDMPSSVPTDEPSAVPSFSTNPSESPSWEPSSFPSDSPSTLPSNQPSLSLMPSVAPSSLPSPSPSGAPSSMPSSSPSGLPSSQPSKVPTMTPSWAPSRLPSSSPTLICHDEPDYRSPINGFVCADHVGTSCIHWRYLGLTLDDLEKLIINCPVSCEIDCGTLFRFDIPISYQISKVPGLLDANTVDDLNALTREYLSDYMRIQEPDFQFFIDNVELLSQKVLKTEEENGSGQNRNLAEESDKPANVNLFVKVAVRGFAFSLNEEETTEGLISGVDSSGYSNAIQNSGNVYLEKAYAFSAAAKTADSLGAALEEVPEDSNSSVAIVVVVVVAVCLLVFCASAYAFHRRNGFDRCRSNSRPRGRKIAERELQSPESQNIQSAVGSMFSFDDTATAGTNGLMRYISSFSRSKDSTSPGSSVHNSVDLDGSGIDAAMQDSIVDEEMGLMTPQADEEKADVTETEQGSAEEEEPHPLDGIIPPMFVYDHIDDGENELGKQNVKSKQRCPSLVPTRRIEASSSFVESLGNRDRPSNAHDLADLFSESNFNFIADPFTDPYSNWRLESRRPSPIGIVMDSDADDDEISVASTPIRLSESGSDVLPAPRRTKSLDSSSILESLSDIIVSSEHDYETAISPIAIPALGTINMDSPGQGRDRFIQVIKNESPTNNPVSPDRNSDSSFERDGSGPETPTLRRNSSHSANSKSRGTQEPRPSFWNRSPIAKGVKEAIWSTKRSVTPTRNGSAPATPPTRSDIPQRRTLVGGPPTTPTRTDLLTRRLSSSNLSSTPTRLDMPAARRGSMNHLPPPSTPTNRLEIAANRRSSTPTRLEMMGRRMPTPSRGEQGPRQSTSPSMPVLQLKSHSDEESHGESRRSLRSRSASFSTAQESIQEEVHFEFRAQRIGKLGLVINSSPQTGPMVEQVKDYSTLFGRIHAGDRIVEVDGVETSHMSIKDVTKRLAGKYGIRTATGEVRIKVARMRQREWNDSDDRRSEHSNGSGTGSVDSFYSYHRRNHSDPEPFLDRLSLNSLSAEHRLSSNSYGNPSKSGEEV